MSTESKQNRSRLKLVLDLILAVTFVLLLNTHILNGLTFHEIAGVAIGLLFAAHLALNWRWVVATTGMMVRKGLPGKIRFGYWLNVLLLVAMGVIIVSGVFISRVLVPGLWRNHPHWVQGTHITLSFLILAVVGIHVGLHWNWISTTVRRVMGAPPSGGRGAKRVVILTVVGLLSVGGYQVYRTQHAVPTAETVPFVAEGRGEPGPGPRPWEDRGKEMRHRGRRFGRPNPWGVVGSYLGILVMVAGATALVERSVDRRRVRRSTGTV